jgi:hypothetical protein
LGNPKWQRDTRWLLQLLTGWKRSAETEDGQLYDAIIDAVRRYPRTASGMVGAGASWDEVLTAIDWPLVVQQERLRAKLRKVRGQHEAERRGLSYPA